MSRLTRRTGQEVQTVILIILDRIAGGTSLNQACKEAGTSIPSVWPNICKNYGQEYQAAVLRRAQLWAEEIVEISDDRTHDRNEDGKGNMASVARDRLRIDARKWLLCKLMPRQYGDALALTGADGGPLEISWAKLPVLDATAEALEAIEGPNASLIEAS